MLILSKNKVINVINKKPSINGNMVMPLSDDKGEHL